MDNLTHSLCGALVERLVVPDHDPVHSRRRTLAAVLVANAPDLDFLMRLLGADTYIFFHRGLTHTLLLFLLLPPLLAWALRRWLDLEFRKAWLLLAAALGSHLLLDVLTSWGTLLLLPFGKARFALDWVFIVDPVMVLCLAVGLALARRSGRRWRERRWGARVGFGALAAYLALAALGHAWAERLVAAQVARDLHTLPSGGSFPPTSYRPGPLAAAPHVQVQAVPAPLAPLFWNGLAALDTGVVYHYSVNFFHQEATLHAVQPQNLEDPLARAFFATEAGRTYLWWARLPRVRESAPDRILLEDLRYDFQGFEAMARPGLLEVKREPDGSLSHHWVAAPLPK